MATKNSPALHLAFDVGHSSIGWAVLSLASPHPLILGTGTVLFPADDCLASQRRAFRRQRRHIRATRQRIARMKTLLAHLGVLTAAQLDAVTSSSPWKLAARVLSGGPLLTWPELWDVLRWYAHNRGYDGNRRWAGGDTSSEADKEDTEKVENARGLMKEHGRKTMAETYCAVLKVDPQGNTASSDIRFKGLNAAFPRDIIEAELRRLLRAHSGKLPAVDASLERALLGSENDPHDDAAWKAITCPALNIPRRFKGSFLLGQSVPRFDNRLIGTCPFTYQSTLAAELAKGTDAATARHRAERMAKVPAADCPEFYRYRWAMTLANVRSDGAPLSLEHRRALDAQMQAAGFMTAKTFKDAVRDLTGHKRDNLDNLLVHPDVERSLVLDPARQAMKGENIQCFWSLLPEKPRLVVLNKLRRGKRLTVGDVLTGHADARAALEKWHAAGGKKGRVKKDAPPLTLEQVLASPIAVNAAKGRAPYTRTVMQAVHWHVFAHTAHPSEEGGPLFRSEAIRKAQLQREIDEQTNNHLVRHRLRILGRLHRDLIKEYAGGDSDRVERCIIEVASELRTLSANDSVAIKKELTERLSNFNSVVKKLEKDLDGTSHRIDAGLIRKGRIAEDLGWECPYTGAQYDAAQLADRAIFDKDHIIPYTQRPSNSLDSLVITPKWVNARKGNRTAWDFIQNEKNRTSPDGKTMLRTPAEFRKHVESLESFKGHDDDKKRKKRRKELLLMEHWEEKDFLPRDLTQTSQLVRLGAQALTSAHAPGEVSNDTPAKKGPVITSLPGSVTGAVRKGWHLLGCLRSVCPEVMMEVTEDDPRKPGESITKMVPKPKSEIRSLTHLHHALDACVLALADHYFPKNDATGSIWQLMVKRNLTAEEADNLVRATKGLYKRGAENRCHLEELPLPIREQIREKLTERRVVQHIPSDKTGLKADQTVWRVLDPKDTHPSAQKLLRLAAKKNLRVPDPDAPAEDQAFITCQKRREGAATKPTKCLRESKQFWLQYDLVAKSKLFGLQPKPGKPARLKALKAVKVVSENFGVAILGGDGQIIRGYNIVSQLNDLAKQNGGKQPTVLRNGMVIRVQKGRYQGVWRVRSIKETSNMGLVIDFSLPDSHGLSKINVRLRSLIGEGLEIVSGSLCGA